MEEERGMWLADDGEVVSSFYAFVPVALILPKATADLGAGVD